MRNWDPETWCSSAERRADADRERGRLELQGHLYRAVTPRGSLERRSRVGHARRDEGGDGRGRNEAAAADDDARELALVQEVVNRLSGDPAQEESRVLDAIELAILHRWAPRRRRWSPFWTGPGCS